MRFSSFLGATPQRSSRGLGALGDVDCERDLLKRLAARWFQALDSDPESPEPSQAFTAAYLASSLRGSSTRLTTGGLFFILKTYMQEYLGSSPSARSFEFLVADASSVSGDFRAWVLANPFPAVPNMSPAQAEAAMLLCRTSASTLTAEARAAATRTREAQARADVAAANAAVTTAATTERATKQANPGPVTRLVKQTQDRTAEARAVADAAAAALVTAVAARVAASAAAGASTGTGTGTGTPATPTPTPTPTPATSFLTNRINISPELLERTRTAILNPRSGEVPLTPPPVEEETSYLPYIAAGGLLIIAAVIFAGKRKDAAPSNSATV